MVNDIQKHIDDIMHKSIERLEIYAAAFIKEVGSHEASKYQLVQESYLDEARNMKIIWRFEKHGQ